MYPDKILGIFHLYGLMIAVGILACFGVLYYYGKKKKIEEDFIDFIFFNAIVAIVLGFGSAALFQATYNYTYGAARRHDRHCRKKTSFVGLHSSFFLLLNKTM